MCNPSAQVGIGHCKKLTFYYEGKKETGEREKGETDTMESVGQERLDLNRVTMVTVLTRKTMQKATAESHLTGDDRPAQQQWKQ